MLVGTYKHQLDEKNRMRMPAKLKKQLGENYYITKGTDGCLFVISNTEMHDTVYSKIKNISMFDDEVQKSIRLLFSSAFESEEDNQGRILLPGELKEYGGIKKNIVIIGAGLRAEIWAEDKWLKYYGEADYDRNIKKLSEHGV